jgi:hypothetical protein
MTVETTQAYIATIRPDHTIQVPAEMPVGANVAVIVLPQPNLIPEDEARQARFARTLAAVQAAMLAQPSASPSEPEVEQLIDRARRSSAA